MTVAPFPPGTFTPRPGAGRPLLMLLAHARTEFVVTVRNAEQLLLTLLIPLLLLIGLSTIDLIAVEAGSARVDAITPRVLALAVMSSAFTGQAIGLGFDRRYGVLKRLAATALPRWTMVAGRLLALLGIVTMQLAVLIVVALLLGWHPEPSGAGWAIMTVLLGILAFGGLGALLGGTLRADIVLALANGLWFILLIAGGIVLTADQLPATLAAVVPWLPSGALADGLRSSLMDGTAPGWAIPVTLLAWAAAAAGLASRTLRVS